MLGSAERRKARLIAVKLFSKNSNACDHSPPTLQMDGQTDKQTTYHGSLIPRSATHRTVKCLKNLVLRQ